MENFRIHIFAALLAVSLAPSASAQDSSLFEIQRLGSEGPVVLFIPALDCHAEAWRPVMESLAGEYRTIAITPAGAAGVQGTGLQNGFLGEIVPELSLLLAAEEAEGATVVGHALGGMVAIRLARTEPQRVAKVLVVDTLPFQLGMMPGMTAEQAKPMADMMVQQMMSMPDEMYRNARKSEMSMFTKSPEFLARLEEWLLASDRATSINAMKETISTDLRPDLAEIAQPIVVLGAWDSSTIPIPVPGNASSMIENAYNDQYSGAQNARVIIVENSRSYVMIDQPEAFRSALNELLGR